MSNFNLNKTFLGGRLTSDPELKTTQSGISVVSFSIAVNRKVKAGEQATADFFNVTAWRGTAEFVSKFFRKGSSIMVIGSLQNRSWTDQNGQKKYATDIVADEVLFVDGRNDAVAQTPTVDANGQHEPNFKATAPKFDELSNDEDIPF